LIVPVPPEKVAAKVEELPEFMVEGEAVKLVIAGSATTVTVTEAVAVAPSVFVTVKV
jgi:hypothetical protein